MTYKLEFLPSALKEWQKLDNSIQTQLKKKLAERLVNPHVVANRLTGWQNHYKIKLKTAGYRLVYEVMDSTKSILVIAVGKRERNAIYELVKTRLISR